MTGKITKASVEEYVKEQAKSQDVILYPIDGIPEGFSYLIRRDVEVAGRRNIGYMVAFIPLRDWGTDGSIVNRPVEVDKDATKVEEEDVLAATAKLVLELYNKYSNGKGN